MNFKRFRHYLQILFILLSGQMMGAEVNSNANIYTPFKHHKYYQGEREQFGYNPQYYPGIFSFDDSNRPYVRTRDGIIQTIDEHGKWIQFDFKPFIKNSYPNWNGSLFAGPFAEERIVFDKTGAAYMCATISRNTPAEKKILLYSKNHCKSWNVYSLPGQFRGWFSKLENLSPALRTKTPPSITLFNGNALYVLLPQKNKSGLRLPPPILVSRNAIQVPTHSGGGNIAVTAGNKTFIVYAGKKSYDNHDGTPQFIVVYDHLSQKCSEPVFMGCNGYGKPNSHNLPAIEVDSKGYLHVFLGSHHNPFQYMHSLRPYDTSEWSKPVSLGYDKTKMGEGSYTYIGVLCDRFDNLHLTARWAGNGYKNHLIYIKKAAKGGWQQQKILVEPFKTLYSCYYHKMSQDIYGRIFVSYCYYGNELTAKQLKAYQAHWPDQKINPPEKLSDFPNGKWINEIKNHDPVCIVSNDCGNSFRLALTPDFVCGITEKQVKVHVKTNTIGMPMVNIPAGNFVMGSLYPGRYDEKPLRPVTISKKFQVGQYPVRVKDFKVFVDETGYKTEFERSQPEQLHNWCGGKFGLGDSRCWNKPGFSQLPDCPVVLITVNDAIAFCQWLSRKEKAIYRLPTEAEWEYACRAGSSSDYFFGNDPRALPRYGWYKANTTGTKPTGMLLPNAWNLYDTCGNVWEYCADYYIPHFSDMPVTDPLQNTVKDSGVSIRGGSWIDDWYGNRNGSNLRSASRYHLVYPLLQSDWIGFRVVKEVKE